MDPNEIPVAHAHVAVIEDDPKKPWKAIVAFVVPVAVAFVSAILPGSDGGQAITGNEWMAIGAAGGITGLSVYAKKNPKRSRGL